MFGLTTRTIPISQSSLRRFRSARPVKLRMARLPQSGLTRDMSEPRGAEGTNPDIGEDRRYRLVLADDHPGVRQEIRRLLDSEFCVLRDVGDGEALVAAAAELRPDAVISDIRMPKLDGVEAGCEVLRRGLCEAIVVLSMYPDRHLVQTVLQAGIRAYVLKVDASDELIPAVYAALRGERYLSSGVRNRSNIDKSNP
jgi:CheY-like chemotaxis protein